VFSGLTWAIAWTMVDTLKLVVEQCVLNQIRGYWPLFDALNVAITICMKLRVDYNHQVVQVPPLAYGAIDDELEILYGCMVAKTMGVLALLFIIYGIYYNYGCSQYVSLNVGVEVQRPKMCH